MKKKFGDSESMIESQVVNNSLEEEQIDFGELFFAIKRRLWVLILCFVIGASAGYFYTDYFIQPLYKSSAMIYVFSKSSTVASLSDLQMGKQLTVDFEILGKSRPVIEKVIEDLNLNTSYAALNSTISITNPEDSRILQVTVVHPNPQLACDIANSLAENLAERVAEVTDTTKPSSVEEAVPARYPFSPSKSRNATLGGVIGMLIALAIILVRFYSDMSLKSEDDVAKYLKLATLATVPFEKSIGNDKNAKKSKKKK